MSYGGLLTAEALSRNSDIFVAGVDLAGVHLYGSSLDSTNLAYQSSADQDSALPAAFSSNFYDGGLEQPTKFDLVINLTTDDKRVLQ